ncbi:phosphotransferase family protein [Devosia ginsengisoli]|uniref:Aminoglycoside phosphotransferase family protein n=1 Tax=Devosia ginsengisoli TaxID=400770 RepID=A0A5B8LME8_9HYPH|nr:aminoglycoside phosphotransferase family protein [Devosia ginsengisoli]QDZ09437.1 aminoglycoside phosphotransferase family protein [Devosia ginsengisoli]
MPASEFTLEGLRDIIVGRFPELADERCIMISEGWDSVAVDVGDRIIFKFPRHPHGEAALRREVAILGLVGAAVSMRVPVLGLFETPRIFSRHDKIPGEHLVTTQYDALDERSRQRLGEVMGQFYAELHRIELADATASGALPVETWLGAEEILRRIQPVLPQALRPFAETTMARWAELAPEPLGMTYGFFDGHGWNMAFDHAAGRLNGIYDFADSGIGPRHQEFIYSNLISADLTARIITAYEGHTGLSIDRDRVDLLTAVHRLWELAMEAHLPAHIDGLLAVLWAWAERR